MAAVLLWFALIMRALVAGLLVVIACTDPPPPAGPELLSRVGVFEIPISGRDRLDLLFVIDNSTAMASYRDNLIAHVPGFVDVLANLQGGMPDTNIAVTSADLAAGGGFRSSPRVDGAYLIDGMRDGIRVRNYTGELGSALAQLADVGAAEAGPARPLDVLPLALAQSGFVRDWAYLGIVVIAAADDASAAAVAGLAGQLKDLKADPSNLIVFGVYPQSSPRLDAFLAQFPNRSFFTPIDAADPSEGFAGFSSLHRSTLSAPCFEWIPADADLDTPGDQYDCVIEQRDHGTGTSTILPRCGAGALPCWNMKPDPQICYGPGVLFTIERGTEGLPYDGASIHGECVVE